MRSDRLVSCLIVFLLLAGEVEVTKGRGDDRKRLGFLSEVSKNEEFCTKNEELCI